MVAGFLISRFIFSLFCFLAAARKKKKKRNDELGAIRECSHVRGSFVVGRAHLFVCVFPPPSARLRPFFFFIFFGPGEKAVFPPGAPLGKQDGSRSSFYGNGFERINTRGVTQTASVDGSSWPHEVEARGYIFYT